MTATSFTSKVQERQWEDDSRSSRSTWRLAWWRFRHNKLSLISLIVLLIFTAAAIAAPWLSPHDPASVNLTQDTRLKPPSSTHLFGTDYLGRDVWARSLYGARVSLAIGFFSTAVSIGIGVIVGSLAGSYGKVVDTLLMRLIDLLLSLPMFFVIVILQSIVARPSIINVIVFIGATSWMSTARIVRGQILSERENDYVLAARCLGVQKWKVMFRHLLPNILGPVIVAATLRVGRAILLESALSYLGFGVQPPTASWGSMLAEARSYLKTGFWMALYPGLFLCLTVLAFNFVGDGLADALNPYKGR